MLHIVGNRILMEIICREENLPKEVMEQANIVLLILESNYNCASMPYQSGGYIGIIKLTNKK